jgi:hypothetical protein
MKRSCGLLSVGLLLLAVAGCDPSEGDRCNPLLFNDDCTSAGLVCVYPPNCGVAFCCPPADKMTAQTSPHCGACPGPDLAMMSTDDAAVDASFPDLTAGAD